MYISENIKNLPPLRPIDFLNVNCEKILPDLNNDYNTSVSTKDKLIIKQKRMSARLDKFQIFQKTYSCYFKKKKFFKNTASYTCKVSKIMLINDKNLPRSCWKIDIIESSIKNFDGVKSTVLVKTTNVKKVKRA